MRRGRGGEIKERTTMHSRARKRISVLLSLLPPSAPSRCSCSRRGTPGFLRCPCGVVREKRDRKREVRRDEAVVKETDEIASEKINRKKSNLTSVIRAAIELDDDAPALDGLEEVCRRLGAGACRGSSRSRGSGVAHLVKKKQKSFAQVLRVWRRNDFYSFLSLSLRKKQKTKKNTSGCAPAQ